MYINITAGILRIGYETKKLNMALFHKNKNNELITTFHTPQNYHISSF